MLEIGRHKLRVPESSDGPPDVPLWLNRLATDLSDVAKDNQGTLAARPVSTAISPGLAGRYFYVTGDPTPANNGRLWRDHGTGWEEIPVGDGAVTPALLNRRSVDFTAASAGAAALTIASVDGELTRAFRLTVDALYDAVNTGAQPFVRINGTDNPTRNSQEERGVNAAGAAIAPAYTNPRTDFGPSLGRIPSDNTARWRLTTELVVFAREPSAGDWRTYFGRYTAKIENAASFYFMGGSIHGAFRLAGGADVTSLALNPDSGAWSGWAQVEPYFGSV